MNFFILGNPRSGTTLLRLMLNTHSKIGVPPESGMILWWYEKYKDWNVEANNDKEHVNQFARDIFSSKKIEEWGISLADIEKVFDQNPKNYLEIFSFLYQNFTNKKIVGDKNNYYIKELDQLSRVAPKSKFIHLVRDGRDVACSYLKLKELEQSLKYIPILPDDLKTIAQEWSENVSNIDDFLVNRDAYLLRYEDLITNPKEVLTGLCAFLELEYEAEMLNFSKQNNEPISTLKWKEKTLQHLDNSNFFKFKEILNEQEILEFNAIAKTNLLKYNYEIEC